jgi:hypothetical protein
VFGHPAHVFFERGIALPATKEIASLCAELSEDPCVSIQRERERERERERDYDVVG